MTFRGDTAVLVLAAGPGTRMRSDTPKVLHTIAGRSMLSHSLHAIAKVAPQHLVVVLGHDHQRIAPLVAELADTLGRTIDVALQDRPLGTGHAVLCGLSALPDDYAGIVVVTSGDTPLLDADTLADLIATHSAAVGRGHGADHDAERSGRLRPHPAHPGQRSDGDRRAHRRDALAARDPRGQRRRLRLRHRRVAVGAEPAELQQRPAGALPHRRHRHPPRRRPDRARPARRRQRAGGRRQQPRPAGRAGRRAEPPHRRRPPDGRRHHRRSRHHLDRRRRDDRPRHRRPPRHPAARPHPDRRSAASSARTPR